jgi:protein-S-isoprenylcysteine O-methyltransferase Ste14
MGPEQGLYLAWGLWALSWWAAALWSNRTAARSTGQWPYRLVTWIGIIMLFQVFQPDQRMIPLWHLGGTGRWAMVGLAALGFGFCWWARLHLGRLWSATITRKQDHKVVDTGPYALVRHPIYTGIILAGFATAIQHGTAVSLAGALLLVLAWTIKARLEERFLRAELGVAVYNDYAARVPMLVPFAKF